MTDSDLQTCRAWCRANGVSVVLTRYHGNPMWTALGFNFHSNVESHTGATERDCYFSLWRRIAPIIQSVRNLDAVEVEGPYSPELVGDQWQVKADITKLDKQNSLKLSEQTARTIANLLNRECQ